MDSTAPRSTGESPARIITPPSWNRAASEFAGNSAFYSALSEASYQYSRPLYGHLAGDYAGEIGRLYAEMARVSESFADQAREMAYAEAHPRCEGDCGKPACEVGKTLEVRSNAPVIVLADIAGRTDGAA